MDRNQSATEFCFIGKCFMKNLVLSILPFLMFGVVNCVAQIEITNCDTKATLNLKKSWQEGEKMPVKVVITNNSKTETVYKLDLALQYILRKDFDYYGYAPEFPQQTFTLASNETKEFEFEASEPNWIDTSVWAEKSFGKLKNLVPGIYNLNVSWKIAKQFSNSVEKCEVANGSNTFEFNLLLGKTNAPKDDLQVSFSGGEVWTKYEIMPVTVSIKNTLPQDRKLRIHSIRFEIFEQNKHKSLISIAKLLEVNKQPLLSLKANEISLEKMDLSDLNLPFSYQFEKFDKLPDGVYDIEFIFQRYEENQTDSIAYRFRKQIKIQNNLTAKNLELIKAVKSLNDADSFRIVESQSDNYNKLQNLRTILKATNAVEILLNLIKTASPEGKLYGLLGLKILNCECFNQQLEIVKKTINLQKRINTGDEILFGKIKIRIQSGGNIYFEDSLLIIQQIADGKFDQILEK